MKYYPSSFDDYTINDKVPHNKPIWACMYDKRFDINLKPTKGKIIELDNMCMIDNKTNQKYTICFIPYKNGKELDSNNIIMNVCGKAYSDTYEESIELYNEYIKNHVKRIECEINKLQNEINYAKREMLSDCDIFNL